MSLSVSMRLIVEATQSGSGDLGMRTAPHKFDTGLIRLLDGIGYDQADLVFSDERTLGGSSEDLDLCGGFTDAFGTAVSPAKIKLVLIANKSQTLALTAKPKASGGWLGMLADASDVLNINKASSQAYAWNAWFAPQGVAIGAGATDSITIGGTAGQVYQILVIGTSA